MTNSNVWSKWLAGYMVDNNHVGHNTISSQSHVPGILGVDRSLVQTSTGKQSCYLESVGSMRILWFHWQVVLYELLELALFRLTMVITRAKERLHSWHWRMLPLLILWCMFWMSWTWCINIQRPLSNWPDVWYSLWYTISGFLTDVT